MANYQLIVPFIIKSEGDWVDNPEDSGGETMKGITYATWQRYYGATYSRFIAMADEDWSTIFKNGYWNVIKGDDINSQKIANTIVDFFWNSGGYAEVDSQILLNALFSDHLTVDGCFGQLTINAINEADATSFYNALIERRKQFYLDIVEKNPSQKEFLQGWMNRITNLIAFNQALEVHI
jgi:lysozyme family protein